MNNYILKQWKKKKLIISLIIIGYFIANIVFSIGISAVKENIKLSYDSTSGNPQNQLLVYLRRQSDEIIIVNEDVKEIAEDISVYGETHVLNLKNISITYNNRLISVSPVAVELNGKAKWNIPILDGRYLQETDGDNSEKEVIIGKLLAQELEVKVGDKVIINDIEEARVIGITGRNDRETQWDNAIYMVSDDLYSINNGFNIYESSPPPILLLKEGKEKFNDDYSEIISRYKDIRIAIQDMNEDIESSSTINSIVISLVSGVSIFVIAIVNIINLTKCWINERKREFAILISLGATKKYLIRCVIKEVVLMTTISSIFALITQEIIYKFALMYFSSIGAYARVTITNLFISIVIAVIVGVLTAIAPARRITKIQPVEVLKNL